MYQKRSAEGAGAPRPPPARIFYRDIGDCLSREKKLEIVRDMRSMLDPQMSLVEITPNDKNDWINQRDGLFDSLIPIGDKKEHLRRNLIDNRGRYVVK